MTTMQLRPIRLLTIDKMLALCLLQSPGANFAVAGVWGRDPLAVLHNHAYQALHLAWYFPSRYHPALTRHATCYAASTRDQESNHLPSRDGLRGALDLAGTPHQKIIELIDLHYLMGEGTQYEMTAELMQVLLHKVKLLLLDKK
jgi:hypothetical protein